MKLGIIGGTGLYEIEGLSDAGSESVSTPFGAPSDSFFHARLQGKDVYFLPRHGRGHRLLPSEINHRANIYGFKELGVDRILSVSAVGSLREDLRPRDIVLPDQYFDRTKESDRHTFFGKGIVAHVALGEPVCADLRKAVYTAARSVLESSPDRDDVQVHLGGTYVNMQGPAFSTKAESHFYRASGFDIIGMTSLAEAKLCREAEICYACMAMVTDYDCWHETEEAVSVELILQILQANANLARAIVRKLIESWPAADACPCHSALATAILTDPKNIPPDTKKALAPIIGKYLRTAH